MHFFGSGVVAMSARGCAAVSIYHYHPTGFPQSPGASGGDSVGRWRKVLSRAFKAAAVADAGADPIRFDPVVCSPLVLLRPSSRCKAGRQVGVIINGRGKILRFAQQRCARPSSTTWCASVAAAWWQFDLNPMDDLRAMSTIVRACMSSSTLLGQHAVYVRCSCAPICGCTGAPFCAGAVPPPPMMWAAATTTSSGDSRGVQQP